MLGASVEVDDTSAQDPAYRPTHPRYVLLTRGGWLTKRQWAARTADSAGAAGLHWRSARLGPTSSDHR
jgi:hypothetical protein